MSRAYFMPTKTIAHLDGEWWTTETVCAFLKIGRKALWERRRDPTLAVPRAYRIAGKRNLYRAPEIKDWATWIAERSQRAVGSTRQPARGRGLEVWNSAMRRGQERSRP